jgi:PHD/YefM family antitoxin component YafN of YafNO toxin-antitoxin module
MLPHIHEISFTDFRKNASSALKLVTAEGGNLWITRHRKPICAVVRMRDAHLLAKLQGRNMKEMMGRLEVDAARMQAAKRLERKYELTEIAGREWEYPIFGP